MGAWMQPEVAIGGFGQFQRYAWYAWPSVCGELAMGGDEDA